MDRLASLVTERSAVRVLAPAVLLAMQLAASGSRAQSAPLLQLQEQPTLLMYGLNPLNPPAFTAKGLF